MSANIIQLVTAAIEQFSDCTWTHENWDLPRDEDGQPVYCSGGEPDTCKTCREARDSAQSAQQFGREALALLKGQPGNGATPRQVFDLVKQARDCEVQWGDAPAWGPAFEAIREIADRGPVSASLKYGNKGCEVYGWTWRLEFDAGVEVDGEWDADADDDAVGHLESLVTREGGAWGGGTFSVSDLGGTGCFVRWTSGIVYRIRFAAAPDKIERSDVGIGSESDALSYANGCADRFGGRRARSYSAGALFAEVTIPGDERQAFEEMLDDDALVAGYSELQS